MKRDFLKNICLIETTLKCNLYCSFCSRDANSDKKFFPLKEIKKIIRESKEDTIGFTGGEPTLYPYLLDAIYYAKSINKKVGIISNGVRFSDKIFCSLILSKIDFLIITVLTLESNTYEKLTNTKSFNLFYKGLHNIKKYSDKYKVRLQFNCVLLNSTFKERRKVLKFLKGFNLLTTVEYVYPFIEGRMTSIIEEELLPYYKVGKFINNTTFFNKKVDFVVQNIPICILKERQNLYIPRKDVKDNTPFTIYRYINNNIESFNLSNEESKVRNEYFPLECLSCTKKNFCFGVQKEYCLKYESIKGK